MSARPRSASPVRAAGRRRESRSTRCRRSTWCWCRTTTTTISTTVPCAAWQRTIPALAGSRPSASRQFLRQRGARDVDELDWWEETRLGSLALGCTPAQHFSARGFRDRNRTLWCGWSLAAPARQLFFAGDSGYHPEFAAIGDRFGPFHAALLPIGAYEPRWFMRPVHMNPEEAVQAFQDLQRSRPPVPGRPAVMVPMHWGTFKLTDEPMAEPPARARRAWQDAGLEPEDLWLLTPGESRAL